MDLSKRVEFLKTVRPFNVLSDDVLSTIAETLQEIKFSKETLIGQQEITKMKGVDIIVEGEYESFFYDSAHNKRLVEHHTRGYCYGGISVLLNRKRSLRNAVAKKGTVVFFLPRKDFKSLCNTYDEFFHYFTTEFGKRMLNEDFAHFAKRPSSFDDSFIATDQLYSRKIESVEPREIIACKSDTPVYKAARLMAESRLSCLFIKDENEHVVGYVTDITLRDKIVATCADPQQPVSAVMDNPIVSISTDAYVHEALLMMFKTKTRYLLIEENNKFKGFISRSKLLSEQTQSPLVFIQSVKLAQSVEELKNKWDMVPQIVTQLLGRGVHAEIVNDVISTIADTIAVKVIDGVIDEIGTPPAKFAFIVLGSEGRKEQTLKTDQDNAIIYEDKANEHRELVREYFLKFASIVSDRLNLIGFVYCTGGYMASNPQWTHSLSHWKRNYISWMQDSLPETVIKFSTFFDCRFIYGEESIMEELKDFLDMQLQKPMETLFFHMAKNALQYQPPLTFFKNIKTITVGSKEVFDIKKSMTPIVDLVRVYALKNRIFKVNTGERLKAFREKGIFSEAEYQEMMQCYYFLMGIRLKKQAKQIIQDKGIPDNYIDPSSLTKIERVTLKEIFRTIENFQSKIKMEFTSNLFG